jgi:hypothetical protein
VRDTAGEPSERRAAQQAGASTDTSTQASAVLRVSPHVEGWNGYSGELAVFPGVVRLSVQTVFARLVRRPLGPPLVHPGPDITMVHIRHELLPWFRAALLVHKSARRVYIPLTRAKAERLSSALRLAGFDVSDVTVGTGNQAVGLFESEWLRHAISHRHASRGTAHSERA